MGRLIGSFCAMDEARDHGMELIAPFVAPGEASTVAFSKVGVDLAIGPVIADQPPVDVQVIPTAGIIDLCGPTLSIRWT